ncbi:hypothetical protein Pcinc_020688 [Petrolisthes cinctipes]|uniref:Uncharacterized protein n=1 Tax=Petrolisthes cinctipes TaxID=88211 RepID=A0AAE1FHY8_PETCI|nr:hypothetical protein Pcinc_020688 [Petrolisthes cinctipes]
MQVVFHPAGGGHLRESLCRQAVVSKKAFRSSIFMEMILESLLLSGEDDDRWPDFSIYDQIFKRRQETDKTDQSRRRAVELRPTDNQHSAPRTARSPLRTMDSSMPAEAEYRLHEIEFQLEAMDGPVVSPVQMAEIEEKIKAMDYIPPRPPSRST